MSLKLCLEVYSFAFASGSVGSQTTKHILVHFELKSRSNNQNGDYGDNGSLRLSQSLTTYGLSKWQLVREDRK